MVQEPKLCLKVALKTVVVWVINLLWSNLPFTQHLMPCLCRIPFAAPAGRAGECPEKWWQVWRDSSDPGAIWVPAMINFGLQETEGQVFWIASAAKLQDVPNFYRFSELRFGLVLPSSSCQKEPCSTHLRVSRKMNIMHRLWHNAACRVSEHSTWASWAKVPLSMV